MRLFTSDPSSFCKIHGFALIIVIDYFPREVIYSKILCVFSKICKRISTWYLFSCRTIAEISRYASGTPWAFSYLQWFFNCVRPQRQFVIPKKCKNLSGSRFFSLIYKNQNIIFEMLVYLTIPHFSIKSKNCWVAYFVEQYDVTLNSIILTYFSFLPKLRTFLNSGPKVKIFYRSHYMIWDCLVWKWSC